MEKVSGSSLVQNITLVMIFHYQCPLIYNEEISTKTAKSLNTNRKKCLQCPSFLFENSYL
jgi:hypothetical protein